MQHSDGLVLTPHHNNRRRDLGIGNMQIRAHTPGHRSIPATVSALSGDVRSHLGMSLA